MCPPSHPTVQTILYLLTFCKEPIPHRLALKAARCRRQGHLGPGHSRAEPLCASDSGSRWQPYRQLSDPSVQWHLLEHFVFSSEGSVQLHWEGLRGLILGLVGASSWGQTGQKCLSLHLWLSHAALTVYICFIVHRFVNIIA